MSNVQLTSNEKTTSPADLIMTRTLSVAVSNVVLGAAYSALTGKDHHFKEDFISGVGIGLVSSMVTLATGDNLISGCTEIGGHIYTLRNNREKDLIDEANL